MLLFLLFLVFTPVSDRSDWASNIEAATNPDDLIEKGMILFNEVSKILNLTDRLVFSRWISCSDSDLWIYNEAGHWNNDSTTVFDVGNSLPSLFYPLSFSSLFATNTSGFNVNWMLHQIYHKISLAQQI